jgi:tRNA U34 2-thiouridine synthase MnmA/TrmU
MSPGLDGALAARLLLEQGVAVEAVHFLTGFARVPSPARFGFPVAVRDVRADYLREVVAQPRFGTGAGANPCLDCKIFLLRRAAAEMEGRGADLVCTGEVLGQDGMSQRREWLLRAAREAGIQDRVLRPLSAQLLPETAAEREGRVDRARLPAAHGRRRGVQAALAARFQLDEKAASAGGCCRLPERAFAARIRDLLAHRSVEEIAPADLEVLHFGRHFRLGPAVKAVVARNEEEGRRLEALSPGRTIARAGRALLWLDADPDGQAEARAASLAAHYGGNREVAFRKGERHRSVLARPPEGAWLEACRVL